MATKKKKNSGMAMLSEDWRIEFYFLFPVLNSFGRSQAATGITLQQESHCNSNHMAVGIMEVPVGKGIIRQRDGYKMAFSS
ncbi:hypothetical protein COLO4_04243 [Corchorus olitorius]|uniref:Uncharacterized protein n=1 Tax=Corchorus olitorius TaxID=93759 RepID=A0A1R3KUR7_9ROSI|nr:hypothetical protein COLO4_04243 [Corchorus olitorius]